MLVVLVLLTGLMLVLGYANKARCTGPEFDAAGRSEPDYDIRIDRDVCYSDIQHLWLGREINHHVFPYLNGSITPEGQLVGGTVEYPVLTGMLIWAGALFAHNDAGFLLGSALLMAPFGLLTGWMLGRLSRWRALVWALGPPLVLYAFHNWDLPVVACAVGAVFVMHGWRTERSLADRGAVAGVLLGLGFAFKLYPGAFVLPLALYVLTASRPGVLHWGAALRVALAAAGTVILVNLPFAVAGYEGWRASFTFQELRKVDLTTNSIWYWGFRPESEPDNVAFQAVINWLSPGLVMLSFAVAAAVGWWRWRRSGVFPWVAVSAAMLCGFLLLHKVHSPQYTLWLLPFFVLLQVPWRWVVGYLIVDLMMGIGIFRWFYALKTGVGIGIYEGFAAQAVAIGVWGRAALLVVLFVVFLRLPDRLADGEADSPVALTGAVRPSPA
ncbi:glycosyltransferase family 87 protein [Pseudonocardia sp. CA-142604]|uniref:glycosyltransferase family 87 protein n=1 Tax=Pseudonocardia sp. CA-142604 TaxID=3240024 RepID=UPI003D8A54A3